MTQRFSDPHIAGAFAGEDIQAFHVGWGRASGRAVIHDKYVDVTDGVIGDDPATASIKTSGRFSLGFPRADHGEELRAHVAIANWPLAELRHAFDLDDWPVDGQIASAEMDLFGPYTGMFGSGRMQLADGVAWKEHFERASADLMLNGVGLSADRITMTKGTGGRITGAAVVKWDGTYSFDATGENLKVESLDNFKVEQAPLTGLLSFTASGAGLFSSPQYQFGGTITDLYASDEFVGEVTGHLSVAGQRLTIDQFNTSSFRLQVNGSGQIVLNDTYDAELTLRFLNTSIDPYLKFFAPKMSPYMRAVASGAVRISGPLADYRHSDRDDERGGRHAVALRVSAAHRRAAEHDVQGRHGHHRALPPGGGRHEPRARGQHVDRQFDDRDSSGRRRQPRDPAGTEHARRRPRGAPRERHRRRSPTRRFRATPMCPQAASAIGRCRGASRM